MTDESDAQLFKKANDTMLSYDQRVTLTMYNKDESGKISFPKPYANKFYGVKNKNEFPSDQDIGYS